MACIKRGMGLTVKVSGPPLAGPLDCRVRPDGVRQSATHPRNATKERASSASRTGAGGQKGLKPAEHLQAKPRARTKPKRLNLRERRNAGIKAGLHKSILERANAQGERLAVGKSA